MQQTPKGIILLREMLKPENRARLTFWDEGRMKEELEKCCDSNPSCNDQQECERLQSRVLDFIPYRRERVVAAPRQQTEAQRYANTIPVLTRSSLKYAYSQKQNRYLC